MSNKPSIISFEKYAEGTAIRDVIAERKRQVEEEGWTIKHDDANHKAGSLSSAGAAYALEASDTLYLHLKKPSTNPPTFWQWDAKWWKPSTPRRDLIKACALLLAEIERIDRET